MGYNRKKNELGRATKRSYSDGTVKDMNKARKIAEIPPIVPKLRNCLRCEKEFESMNGGHRMCAQCSCKQEVVF